MTPPRLRGAAFVVVLCVLLAGCGLVSPTREGSSAGSTGAKPSLSPSPIESPEASAGGTASSAPDTRLTTYYDQELTWKDCREKAQCARMDVPLDYADPGGRSISLSVLRVRATHPDRRIGSLVVNPGGPGGSGVTYAAGAGASFGPELLAGFDIVGFDPRGVGESTPLRCESTAELDTLIASDPDPDTPAETRHSDRLLRDLGKACLDQNGDLARHMSTVEVAQDLDVLRAVLGDRKLSFFGASYGTFIGATYADRFPQRVGRMVLDGALNPALSTTQLSLVQAKGFEVALRAYVGACVDRGSCFLGDSVDAATRSIRSFLDDVERRPLPGSGPRQLQVGNAVLGIWLPLYNKNYWPLLDQALRSAYGGDGSSLLRLADAYVARGPKGYEDNSLEALYAVNCLDHDDGVPSSQVGRYVARFEKASPTFGAAFAYGLSACANWPVRSGTTAGAIEAKGAAPILVVGTTRDPATPLVWAEQLADQLESGVLVRRDGDGHTGYRAGNACVDRTVEQYLVQGTVPPSEVDC